MGSREQGITSGKEGQSVENLYKIVDGQIVFRQLKPPEITDFDRLPQIITPQGFAIRGQNSTSLIRGLSRLTLLDENGILNPNPAEISFIEHELRPVRFDDEHTKLRREHEYSRDPELNNKYKSYPHGVLTEGIIGENESFIENLALTNDEVTKLNNKFSTNITHRKLAAFLLYFENAYNFISDTEAFKELPNDVKNAPLYLEYNGRIFLWNRESRQRMGNRMITRSIKSPLNDGYVFPNDREYLFLARAKESDALQIPEDSFHFLSGYGYRLNENTGEYIDNGGSQITFNPKIPAWINKYGFHGGRDIRNDDVLEPGHTFRLTPTEIAGIAGFIPVQINNKKNIL